MPAIDEVWSVQVWRDFWARVLLLLPQLATGILLFLLFWIAGAVVQRLLTRLCRVRRIDADLTLLFGRAAKITLLSFGAMTALGTAGIDVTAMVAGLGLTGFAVGFALKDVISNALSGILIILYEPFHRSDHIAVTGLEGTVTEINLRYTVLDAEGKRVFIPNANLFTNPVVVQKPGWVQPALPEPASTSAVRPPPA